MIKIKNQALYDECIKKFLDEYADKDETSYNTFLDLLDDTEVEDALIEYFKYATDSSTTISSFNVDAYDKILNDLEKEEKLSFICMLHWITNEVSNSSSAYIPEILSDSSSSLILTPELYSIVDRLVTFNFDEVFSIIVDTLKIESLDKVRNSMYSGHVGNTKTDRAILMFRGNSVETNLDIQINNLSYFKEIKYVDSPNDISFNIAKKAQKDNVIEKIDLNQVPSVYICNLGGSSFNTYKKLKTLLLPKHPELSREAALKEMKEKPQAYDIPGLITLNIGKEIQFPQDFNIYKYKGNIIDLHTGVKLKNDSKDEKDNISEEELMHNKELHQTLTQNVAKHLKSI